MDEPEQASPPWPIPWAAFGIAAAIIALTATSQWARLAEHLPHSGATLGALVLLWLLPLAWGVHALERGRPAQALRSPLAPWALLGLTHLSVQLSGGLSSPLFGAYTLVLLFAGRHRGWPALLMAALVSLLELLPLLKMLPPENPPLLPVWAGLLSPWAGALLGLWAPAPSGDLDGAPRPSRPAYKEREGGAPAAAVGGSLAGADAVLDLPVWDTADTLERELNMLLDMGFHSHPDWNALGLWWGDAVAVERRSLKLRSGQPAPARRVSAGEGMIGLCLKDRRPVPVDSLVPTVASQLPYYAGEAPAKAFYAVPLLNEGEPCGVLVCDRAQPGAFSPEEQAALDTLGKQMVKRAQVAADVAKLQAQSQRYSSLYGVIREMASDLDRDALLSRLAGILGRLVPFDSFYLALDEDQDGGLKRVASQGYDTAAAALDLSEHGTLASFLRVGGEAVAFHLQGGSQVPEFLTQGLQAPAEAYLLVPLSLAGRLSGVLKLDRASRAFSQTEKELALIAASQAAVTLEHARLYTLHKRQATTDGLTGLYNHRYFQERLAHEIQQASRTGKPLSLGLTDIDHFKKFNDTFGHQEGDVVLKRVAKLLQEKVRRDKDIVCRYGGEEFVVILPNCDLVEARQVLDELRSHCAKHLIGGSGPEARAITLSVGLCTYPQGAKEQRELIHLADEALYKAKKGGRDRVCSFKDLP